MADDSSRVSGSQRGGIENLRPWKPGESGNKDGGPKWLKEIRNGLRSLLPETMDRLGEIIRNGSDKDSTAAARVVLEYTVPKPKQTHRVEGKGGDPLAVLTPDQLVEFIKGRKE